MKKKGKGYYFWVEEEKGVIAQRVKVDGKYKDSFIDTNRHIETALNGREGLREHFIKVAVPKLVEAIQELLEDIYKDAETHAELLAELKMYWEKHNNFDWEYYPEGWQRVKINHLARACANIFSKLED